MKTTDIPWIAKRENDKVIILGGPSRRYVATVQIHQTPRDCGLISEPEREANAELICRAVNAHEALNALLDRVELFHRGVAESVELIGLAQSARAALTQATTKEAGRE